MLENKNIKIITFGNFPYGRASANYLRNLSFVISQKHNVEVLLPVGYNYGDVKNKSTTRKNTINKVKYRHLGYIHRPNHFFGKFIDSVWGKVRLYSSIIFTGIKRKTDIVVIYNINFFSRLLILLICKTFKVRTVVILSEFYPKPKQIGINLLKWYNFYLGIKYLSKYFDGVIALTNYLSQYVRDNRFKGKLLLLPNIVNPNEFNLNTSPYLKCKITIGYTGTPTKKDGIDELLKSFAIVNKKQSKTHLLIIGDTPKKSVLAALQEKANQLQIGSNVSFTGLVSSSEVPFLLNSCDILMLIRPNNIQSEAGFPTKLGEYMACKKPVISSSVGDMKEYFINKNIVYLVEPENIDSISRGLEDLILDKNKRDLIGNAGYNWMLDNLSISGVSKKTHDFIASIM